MSSKVKLWFSRGALAMPIVVSAGASLWFTRAPVEPDRAPVVVAAAAADDDASQASSSAEPADSTLTPEQMEARMRRRRAEAIATLPASAVNESEAAEALLREYAPHVSKRLDRMPADAPVRVRLQRQMQERARDLLRMKQRDPEQFKNEIEQFKLEDEVADLGRRLMRRGDLSATEQSTLEADLRKTVEKLVDVRLRNRDARLARLANTLATEKQKLRTDQENRDKLVERQYQTVINNRRPFANPSGGAGERRPTLAAPDGPRRGADRDRDGGSPPRSDADRPSAEDARAK